MFAAFARAFVGAPGASISLFVGRAAALFPICLFGVINWPRAANSQTRAMAYQGVRGDSIARCPYRPPCGIGRYRARLRIRGPHPPAHPEAMVETEVFLPLNGIADDKRKPAGFRLVADGYLLLGMASIRFTDANVIFEFRTNDTSLRSRTRDLERRGRPIMLRPTTSAGLCGPRDWDRISLGTRHPADHGRMPLFPITDDGRPVRPARAARYNLAFRISRRIRVDLGFAHPKWTLRTARARFRTCANQLGRSEGDRRKSGHRAPGASMMGRYDRASCATELRIRVSILSRIRDDAWAPAPARQFPPVAGAATGSRRSVAGAAPNPKTDIDKTSAISTQTSAGSDAIESALSESTNSDFPKKSPICRHNRRMCIVAGF